MILTAYLGVYFIFSFKSESNVKYSDFPKDVPKRAHGSILKQLGEIYSSKRREKKGFQLPTMCQDVLKMLNYSPLG